MGLHHTLLIAFGGAAGAVARYAVSMFCVEIFGERFPWGTFLVNVVGCFLAGWLLFASNGVSDSVKIGVGTGFLGAFTTFSTFGVQTILLWDRSPIIAVGNVAANIAVGLAAAMAGIYIATQMSSATSP